MTSLVFVPERLCLSCIQTSKIPVGDKPGPETGLSRICLPEACKRAHDKFTSTALVHMAIGKLTRLQPPSETTGPGG